jgi:hypothetical protein
MSSIVMTIHTFNHSYADFSTSEIQSSSCTHSCLSVRHAGKLFINEVGKRHLHSCSAKRHPDLWQQASEICGGEAATVVDLHGNSLTRTFIHKRTDFNTNSNEVSQ